MSYQVLARKLRPTSFAELIGQEHVVRAMVHALEHDRLHHAYLFTGTRGVGKTTVARILARALNCETGVTAEPCGTCTSCVEILEGRFIDLIEVDAASRTGVADTRDLLDNAQYRPTRGRYKVYLIDEVHMLSTQSFNALLKTLEEPPEHVKFLLATTDPKKVPVTVLSRCLQFQLKNLSAQDIGAYLKQVLTEEGVATDEEGPGIIAAAARGSMRDALSITDQAIAFGGGAIAVADVKEMLGVIGKDETDALLRALAAADAGALLECCAALYERNIDFAGALESLIQALHDQAVRHATNQSNERDLPPEVVQLYYQIAIMGTRDLAVAPDPRCGFEMTMLRMLHFTPNELPADAQGGGGGGIQTAVDSVSAASGGAKVSRASSQKASPGKATDTEPGALPQDPVPAFEQPAMSAAAPEHPVESKPAPESTQPTAPASPPPIPRTELETDEWARIVAASTLKGVARMIAEHSIVAEKTDEVWRLVLDSQHDTLLNASQAAAVERMIQSVAGGQVKVLIESGVPTIETPADRTVRLAAERQAAAELALRSDATVRSLIDEFEGSLGSVVALDETSVLTEVNAADVDGAEVSEMLEPIQNETADTQTRQETQ